MKIDLGEKLDHKELNLTEPAPDESRVIYPSLNLYNIPGTDLSKLPKKGKMVIEYEVKRVNISEDDVRGVKKVRTSCDIEVHSMEPILKKGVRIVETKKEKPESETAMESLMGALEA